MTVINILSFASLCGKKCTGPTCIVSNFYHAPMIMAVSWKAKVNTQGHVPAPTTKHLCWAPEQSNPKYSYKHSTTQTTSKGFVEQSNLGPIVILSTSSVSVVWSSYCLWWWVSNKDSAESIVNKYAWEVSIYQIIPKTSERQEIGTAFLSMFMFIVIFVLLKTWHLFATCLYHGGVFGASFPWGFMKHPCFIAVEIQTCMLNTLKKHYVF